MKCGTLLLILLSNLHFLCASNPPVTVVSYGSNSGLIFVRAEVDDKPGFFILDTGTPKLILNRNFFEGTPSNDLFHDIHGGNLTMQTKDVCLSIGDFCKATQAIITDFTSIEHTTKLPVLGVIGNSVFEDCEIVFDYIFKELTIYCLDRNGDPLQPRYLHEAPPLEAIPFELKGNLLVIEVMVGGHARKMALDTGAGVNVMETGNRKHIKPYIEALDEKNLVGFGDQSRLTPRSMVSELSVGQVRCPPMPTFMLSLKKLNKSLPGPKLDGILGHEFINRFRIAINFRKKEFKIWDTPHVEEQFALAKSKKIE